jgi:hypothetical protein
VTRAVLPWLLALLAAPCAGCTSDALYTYCTADEQCGSRTYEDGDEEIEVFLSCVEVEVDVRVDRPTHGSFCTLDCFDDRDCDSFIGLPDGVCIQWAGDDAAFCYQRCASDRDCYPSSTCEGVLLDGAPIDVCLPDRL